jgi:hypothetical protein
MLRGGLIVRQGSERRFVPAELTKALVLPARTTLLPGSAFEIALVRGQIALVIRLGTHNATWLLCSLDGQLVAFAGLEVESTGRYQAHASGVWVSGELVSELDVQSEFARFAPAPQQHSVEEIRK